MSTLKNTTINDTGYLQLAAGTTLQRPSGGTLAVGQTRYNTDTGNVEGYAATGWHVLSPINLSITAITPVSGFIDATSSTKQINPSVSAVFTISGFNFTPTTTVKFDTTAIPSGMVTYVNPETLTITTGSGNTLPSGTWSTISVVDAHGKTSSISYPLQVVGGPVFSTATSLGTVTEGSISVSVAATSPGGTVTYSANSVSGGGGSGYGLPAGLSINSSTGAITGSIVLSGTTTAVYNLTIKATDDSARTSSKDFVLTVTNATNPTITSPSAGSLGTLYYQPVSNDASVTAAPSSLGITSIVSSNPSSSTLEYILSSGSLPPGVTLDSSTGALYGSLILGNKTASTTYTFGVTARDALMNSSAEVVYSLNTNIPFYYRQILSTGYSIGGYKSGTPWKNVNRFPMSTEITLSLGDLLTTAVSYHGAAVSADSIYQFGVNSSGAHDTPGTLTQIFNMRTESTSSGTATAKGNRGQAACAAGIDGFQTHAYVTGGFTGTNSDAIEKYVFATGDLTSISGTSSTTNYASAWGGSDELFAVLLGSSTRSGATSQQVKITFSSDTTSTYAATLSGSDQGKFLMSKLNRIYGSNGAGYGDASTASNGTENFRKTIWSTGDQYVVSKGYGAHMAEENYIMGQDRGWAVGIHDGTQNNNAIRFIYATDTGMRADNTMSRKGTTGASSGNGGWRD